MDRFTRWPEAIPIANITAETVARAFVAGWIARFGVPSTITKDRGSQFQSALWHQLMILLGSHRIRTTSYHPIANGIVERFHRQLKASLKSSPTPTHWVSSLPMVLLGIRTGLKGDIGCSAAELVYGTTLRVPGEFFCTTTGHSIPYPASYVEQLKIVMHKLRAAPPRRQQRKSYVSPDLTSGTHVFVRHDAIRKSLQQPYDGPYKVLKRSKKHFTVLVKGRNEVISIDRLKPAYLEVTPAPDLPRMTSPSPADVQDPTPVSPSPPDVHDPPAVQDPPPVRVSRSGRHIRWPDRLNL